HIERAQIELHRNDFPAAIAASQKGIRVLGDWPPPHNNLSLALFWNGQPEEAIAAARRVLSQHPDDVHALANLVRFLTWTGRESEAQALWPRLQDVTPQEYGKWIKIVEAAAILGEDESVYQLLNAPPAGRSQLSSREQYFLAIAEANIGRTRPARRRLRRLQSSMPWAAENLAALKAKQPGPGWAERFPYFYSVELVPRDELSDFMELIIGQDDHSSRQVRGQIERFVARFPQIVRMAEKLLWEEGQPDAGIGMLEIIATPAAYAALRRFGLSQAGDDEMRLQVLTNLLQAGEIQKDEVLRIWIKGEWREVQLRGYEISEEGESEYTPEVADLINQGTAASQRGDRKRAERLFLRALEKEPRAKEAYNNLGAIYAHREEHERAREMFRKAVAIDPLYVFPRCNLASYLLGERDVDGAEAMLEPLADVTRLHPQEMAFYSFTQARILVHREEYEAAQRTLETTLEVCPDYEPALNLLDWIDKVSSVSAGFKSFWEKQHERDLAKRTRLQAQLTTPDPTLSEALPIYTKNALTGMGDVVIWYGGWSALRKAELVEEIIKGLTNPDNLAGIVAELSDEEQDALRQVLAQGGDMNWDDFASRYDEDLDESSYWQWHTPETTMGRLRLRGLLVEATVDDELRIVVPSDLRRDLEDIL
ncbi:MAG TPA: tetratricopeptide repeat protein, partial [Chloroflexi bacterium]|nr:tetratricopeptide repeat protein [Chloroflexota bacterium]